MLLGLGFQAVQPPLEVFQQLPAFPKARNALLREKKKKKEEEEERRRRRRKKQKEAERERRGWELTVNKSLVLCYCK